MSGRQRISDDNRGNFTILLNLLDVWRDERGELLEPWAIRVYFHFARIAWNGPVEESERETATACAISKGLAHAARLRLAETGWITLEYEGVPGHEVAHITLIDRQAENSAYWAPLKPKRDRSGLRSYSERKADGDGLRSPGDQLRSHSERGAHPVTTSAHPVTTSAHPVTTSAHYVGAKTVPSSSPVKDLKTGRPEDARAREEFFEDVHHWPTGVQP